MGVKKPNFIFLCYAVAGIGISGGDRIFIEFIKRWNKHFDISVYTGEEGRILLEKQKVETGDIKLKILANEKYLQSFWVNYLYKIYCSIKIAFQIRNPDYIYSASEFWMDSLPAIILKFRFPKAKWIAAWYQTAPNPLKGYSEINRKSVYRLSAFYLWLAQLPIKPFVMRFADHVLVNNNLERAQFPEKTEVVLGAVNLEEIEQWQKQHRYPIKYAAIFQGRFHPQKGVIELVKIWGLVVDQLPKAKLAMIGDGPLMEEVKKTIKDLRLEGHITLFGYVFDGSKKYQIFSQSQIVVHPAFFDSGGMAAAEAMAFGLPCVAFNLKSYASYYPKGMHKVKSGELKDFAKAIVHILKDNQYRINLGREALEMIKSNWSWNKRADEIYEKIK